MKSCSRSPRSQLSHSLKENSYCSNTPNPTSVQIENPCHFQKLYVPRVQIDLMTSMQTGVQQSPEMFQVGPLQPNPVWSCRHLHNQWITAKGVARAKGTGSATMQNNRRSLDAFFLEPGPHDDSHICVSHDMDSFHATEFKWSSFCDCACHPNAVAMQPYFRV
jgi:hypothetical protein